MEVPPARPWNDHIEGDIVAEDKAMEIVMANQNLFVQGLAGTGKTTLVKKLVAALKEKGERVECCAFTHVAAKNIGGCTLHHFAHKHVFNGSYKGWLVVDEVGQLTLPLVAALNRMLMYEKA